jgi:hypothetical protein
MINATSAFSTQDSVVSGMWLWEEALQLLQAVHVELFVFLIAVGTHLVLFGNVRKVFSIPGECRRRSKVCRIPPLATMILPPSCSNVEILLQFVQGSSGMNLQLLHPSFVL